MSQDKKQSEKKSEKKSKKSSSKDQSPKKKGGTKLDAYLDRYIHTKPATYSPEWKEHAKLFIWPAGLLALIPSYLFWGAYDYRADGFIGVEYIVYLITLAATILGLLTSYTQTYVDHVYLLKVSSQSKVSKKRVAEIEVQSKWWTIFQINGLYLLLFLFANFYALGTLIPILHFRYLLTTAGPAAVIHLWIHGMRWGGKDNQKS